MSMIVYVYEHSRYPLVYSIVFNSFKIKIYIITLYIFHRGES